MVAYVYNSLISACGQLMDLFGLTFVLAFALYQVSMAMRRLGADRLGLLYFYIVAPGVACHEAGHALGCVLTGKRIVEFVPFKPRVEEDGVTLGYVRHESRPTILSRAGEFLVATGPVWLGSAMILLLVRMLVGPAPFDYLSGIDVNDIPTGLLGYVRAVSTAAFGLAANSFSVWRWQGLLDAVWAYLLICIASEVTLSGPDLRGMWVGLFAIVSLFLVGNCIPFADKALESGMAWLAPRLFLLHATLAFVLSWTSASTCCTASRTRCSRLHPGKAKRLNE